MPERFWAKALLPMLGLLTSALLLCPVRAQTQDELSSPTAQASLLAEVPDDSYQISEFEWTDLSRQRAVPVRLYWPSHLGADAKPALVVFSHGIGGSRRGYTYLGAYWASQGYASLHLQHVGSDRNSGSAIPSACPVDCKAQRKMVKPSAACKTCTLRWTSFWPVPWAGRSTRAASSPPATRMAPTPPCWP